MKALADRNAILSSAQFPSQQIHDAVMKMAESCRIVSETLIHAGSLVRPGISTLELDKAAEEYILSQGGVPAFKGYRVGRNTFPSTLCISVNDAVVHGIPSADIILEEGDIVSLDCGVHKDGYFGDSAFTFPVGELDEETSRLLAVTRASLEEGVTHAVVGKKVYDISRAVQSFVESNKCSVVRDLVGHGIGRKLHEDPAIPNFVPPLLHRDSYPNSKLRLGQGLAIEPMVNLGSHKVKTDSDGWTVRTADGKRSAHFEHTVIVYSDSPLVLTFFQDTL